MWTMPGWKKIRQIKMMMKKIKDTHSPSLYGQSPMRSTAMSGSQERGMMGTDTSMVEYMRLALIGRVPLNSEVWKRFLHEMEERFPHFRETVHAEKLRCEEYRICLLLKAGFTPTETEFLINFKAKTLSTYQRRLLQKIFHVDGNAKELRERLRESPDSFGHFQS